MLLSNFAAVFIILVFRPGVSMSLSLATAWIIGTFLMWPKIRPEINRIETGAPRAPRGMHCPVCKEKGPDLTVDGHDLAVLPPSAVVAFEFSCGECDRRWRWQIRPCPDNGVSYSLLERKS
jgi:hypothetical protein